MKKLISNIGNWSFILLAVLFLAVTSCTDDDDNQEPAEPSPDGKVDTDSVGLNLLLEDNKVFVLG